MDFQANYIIASQHQFQYDLRMKTIRTTITLPVDLHEQLRHQAIDEKISFNDVVLRVMSKFTYEDPVLRKARLLQKAKDDLAFFREMALKHPSTDEKTPAELVREDRDYGHD